MSTTEQSRSLPAAVRRHIEFHAGKTCTSCGREIDGDKLLQHIDHIIPRSLNGENAIFNLQALYHECNLAKGSKITPRAQALIDLRKRRRKQIRRYFQQVPAHIDGNSQLRRPQREAHLSVKDHFGDGGDLPGMVVLPTGVGKTGVIAIVPYGIAKGRVLIIAPNLTIKNGLEEKLSGQSAVYRKYGVLGNGQPMPRVVVLKSGRVNEEDCLKADIVIANIQQVQGWLHLFQSDFFDLIVVDEAHHVPATSWQNVHETFPNAKSVYVTATPFRSDGQPIVAEEVYEFSLAEAMKEGYVKNVARVSARASEMTFTIDGEERELDLEEILEMREETWFSRSVALSEASNRTIIERTIAIWKKKRESGVQHQIIAAACSVEHARDLKVLFESYGLRATYVVSRGMTLDERDQRIDDFDAGKYDVIVHVGILGEGYDNENISIAAIFRPYRSTAPFAQFVGRAIRCIDEGDSDDNIAHVVDHVGLNMDECWEYFKSQEQQAHVLKALDEVEDGEGDGEREAGDRNERRGEVTSETIEGFDLDVFVRMNGVDPESLGKDMENLEAAIDSMRSQGVNVPDASDLKNQIADLNRPVDGSAAPTPTNRPDKERQARRKKLDNAERKAAGRIVQSMEIDGGDDDLVEAIGKGDESSNYEVVIRTLHRNLNRAMNKDGSNSERNKWLSDEFKQAEKRLPEVEDALTADIEAQTDYQRGGPDFRKPPFPF